MGQLSTLQYLDKAMSGLRELGLIKGEGEQAPIIPLLNQISDLDDDRVTAIARTLNEASRFNEVVREQIEDIKVAQRYDKITKDFDTIRDDSKGLLDQYADGQISTRERIGNVWMKMTRGSIAKRFDRIKDTYLEVADETKNQIEREQMILEAYMDFRGAMKTSEIEAYEVLKKAEAELDGARGAVQQAVTTVDEYSGEDQAERSRLELMRDECLRELQNSDKRYQISKDLSDNLTVGYNTSEVVMARLVQMRNAKERIYAQSVSFFSTNEVVLTALTASLTGMHGLHESTATLNAMKEGVEQSLEVLADVGGKVQEAATRAGYGPTVSAAAIQKLLDSVINYQEHSQRIIHEMREMSTENSSEIREIVEEGKQRLARLTQEGANPYGSTSEDDLVLLEERNSA
jgi:hypothetical protein